MSENKEKNVKEEKKKGHLLLVICLIALMVLCGGLGYFLGTSDLITFKHESLEQGTSVVSDDKETDNLKDVEVDEFMGVLLDKITTADVCSLSKYNTFYKKEKVTTNDLSKGVVQLIMIHNLRKKGFTFDEHSIFTSDDVQGVIKNVFGKNYNYVDESIDGYCPTITYNSQNKQYVVGIHACGGSCGPHTVDKILSAKRNSNTVELTVGVIFGPRDGDTKMYSDYDRTNVIVEDGNISDADYKKGAKYKVIFKIEDGNYIFVSSEPIK